MGQIFSYKTYRVAEPKTPYEYSSKDLLLTEEDLNNLMEYIQDELNNDAKNIENYILDEVQNGNGNGVAWFYECNILRVKLDPLKYKESHGVLSRELRVKCLIKNLKIPFVAFTRSEGAGYLSTISYVHNVPKLKLE